MSKPVIRCSELGQFLACPGSLQLKQRVPASPDDDSSAEGTMGHWLIADRCIRDLGASAGGEGVLPPPNVEPGYEMPARSLWMIDWCVRTLADYIPDGWAMVVEDAFAWEFERFILLGHVDVFGVDPDLSEVRFRDWKLGPIGAGSADNNWQMLGYIVLIYLAYEKRFQSITASLAQPRALLDEDQDRVSEVTVEGETLKELPAALESRINAALARPLDLETGPSQCRYCPAIMVCPAVRKLLETMKLKMTPEMLANLPKLDHPALGSLVKDTRVLKDLMNIAEHRLKQVLDHEKTIVCEDGTTITVQYRQGRWQVKDKQAFYATLAGKFEPHDVANVISPSCSEMVKVLAKTHGVKQSSKNPENVTGETLFAEMFGPYLERGEPARILKFE